MSIAATVPVTTFTVVPWVDRGLSDDADVVRKLTIRATEFPGSVVLGEPKRVVQEALAAACVAEVLKCRAHPRPGPRDV